LHTAIDYSAILQTHRVHAFASVALSTATETPPRTLRAVVALAVGLLAGAYVLRVYGPAPITVSDFDAIWAAGRALREGRDPYAAIRTPPWPWPLQYPLPAVLLALPFTWLPVALARAAFVAVGSGLLAWGLTARAWWPLWMLAGGQMFAAVGSVQWTPLFSAGVLLPALRWIWFAKPTTAAVLFAAIPDRRVVLGGILMLVAAFVIWPGWIHGWLAAAASAPHRPAILRPAGFLLLLGLLRWRRPEGRQLAAIALVPLGPYIYEGVPLLLFARSRRELLLLTCCGTLGLLAGLLIMRQGGPGHNPIDWLIVLFSCYLPALVVVLRRPDRTEPGLLW
jgi:hypothetical protein